MGTNQNRGRPMHRTRVPSVKLPPPPPVKEPPEPKLEVDFATLGTRTITTNKMRSVVVGKTDLGKNIVTSKNVPVTTTKLTPMLTLKEAKLLGPQPWAIFPPYADRGIYFCKTHGRRFMVTTEICEELKDAGLVG